MYDPFGYETVKEILKNIQQSLVNYPRRIRFVYSGPVHQRLLDRQEWLKLEQELERNKILIWRNKLRN